MIKGILLEAKGPIGVVMTPDGRFVRVLLNRENKILGQEVVGREIRLPSLIQGFAVASVLLIAVMLGIWTKMMPASAAAYVALDINPSLELTVDSSGRVIEARGLDDDGINLLQKADPNTLEVYRAVELLVQGAAKYNYLNETNNVVLATVTSVNSANEKTELVVDKEKLEASVNNCVASLPAPVKVVTETATMEERQHANNEGISVGRYLIYQGSTKQGGNISIKDVKTKGLGQLEKEKSIEIQTLLPHPKYRVEVVKAQTEKAQIKPEKKNENKSEENKDVDHSKDQIPSNEIPKHTPPGQAKIEQQPKLKIDEKMSEQPVLPGEKRVEEKDNGKQPVKKETDQQRRDDRRQSQLDNSKQPEPKNNNSNKQQENPKKENKSIDDNSKEKDQKENSNNKINGKEKGTGSKSTGGSDKQSSNNNTKEKKKHD